MAFYPPPPPPPTHSLSLSLSLSNGGERRRRMFVTHASPSYKTLVDAQVIHDLKRWRWLFHSLHFHKHYTMYIGQNVMCRFSRIVPYLDSCLTYERFYSKFNYMFKCQVGKFEWRKYSLNIEISEHMCACVRVCVCVFCALRYVKLALPFYECGGS
jgi:hypothetical protein